MKSGFLKISLPLIAGFLLTLFAVLNFNTKVLANSSNNNNVTICHRTTSVTNPYNTITVDKKAADGVAGNTNSNQPDHYGEHQGPLASSQAVAQALKDSHTEWGDIIPPISPYHNGLNWTTQGQAIYNNDCNYVTPTPTPRVTPSPTPTLSPSPTPHDDCDDHHDCDHHDECDEDHHDEHHDEDEDDDCDHHSPKPTPSPSPTATPTPTPSPSPTTPPVGGSDGGSNGGGGGSTISCPNDRPQKVDKVWFSDVSANQVTVHWANKGDAWGYQVAYGPKADDMPWGVEVGNVSEVTLKDLPGGSLFVKVIAKSSKECGGPSSDTFEVGGVGGGQVLGINTLGATGFSQSMIIFALGLTSIFAGLWQTQKRFAKSGAKNK